MKNDSLKAISEIINIELELESHIPTTLWITDLHGEGKRFLNILKGRFGLIYQTIREALPMTVGEKHVHYLSRLIRKRVYFPDPQEIMDKQDVVNMLIRILRYKYSNRRYKSKMFLKGQYREVILMLLNDSYVPDALFERDILVDQLINELCQACMILVLDHLVVLGDIYDRGSTPDLIVNTLMMPTVEASSTLILGNHDVLWMGACAGNKSLVAEALRITCRYDHLDFLERMNIDISRLKAFALKHYPPDSITGKYKAEKPESRSMEKALSIIQFKLEEQTIAKFPEFEMESRLWLKEFAGLLQSGNTEGLSDISLPTLDPENPSALSGEEQEIIDDLTSQMSTSKRLKRHMNFFFRKGKVYHVHNGILNIHALIPSTEDGQFQEVFGYKGKELLNFLEERIEITGKRMMENAPQDEFDLALFFYLWCGPKSPFFGKEAMKTFERYFIKDKATHKERTLYWKKNLSDPGFRDLLKKEFDIDHVVFGHVPVNFEKGEKMADEDGFTINVDGGFAAAYFHRGHALVRTPKQLYGIVLPTPREMVDALESQKSVPLNVEIIRNYPHPTKVKDTRLAKKLQARKTELLKELEENQ